MPLIPIVKKIKEPEYIFSNYEKLALEILPPEQVRASNHQEEIIDLMLDAESRDASPEHTRNDIYRAIDTKNLARVLAASKNLSISEKNKIVQGIYNHLLNKKEDMSPTEAKRLALLFEDTEIDLFDFCAEVSLLK